MQILPIPCRDAAMVTMFGFLYMGSHWHHLANTIELRCGLMSNYFDHLFALVLDYETMCGTWAVSKWVIE